MTVYHNTGGGQVAIITETEFADRVSAADAVRFMNRESNEQQDHTKNVAELAAAHKRLGLQEPFTSYPFYGSGKVRFLNDTGWDGRYFCQLRELIEDGLQQTQGTLYVIIPCIDRLLRHVRYHPYKKETYLLRPSDYKMFWEWMVFHFKQRARDVVFVVLFEGTPAAIRGRESSLGMRQSGNMGGRPPKKTRMDKVTRERLQAEAIFLAETTLMNGKDIWNLFDARGETTGYSSIKKWLRENGLSRNRGKRARKTHTENR